MVKNKRTCWPVVYTASDKLPRQTHGKWRNPSSSSPLWWTGRILPHVHVHIRKSTTRSGGQEDSLTDGCRTGLEGGSELHLGQESPLCESSSVTRFSGANSYHGSVHTSTAGGAAVDMVRGWGAKRQTYLQQQLENRSGKMMSQGIIGRDHLLRLFTEWRHLLETCGTLWFKPFVFSQYLIAGFQFQCLPQYANGFCILPFQSQYLHRDNITPSHIMQNRALQMGLQLGKRKEPKVYTRCLTIPCPCGTEPWYYRAGGPARPRRTWARRRSGPASAGRPPCCLSTSPSRPAAPSPPPAWCPLASTTTTTTTTTTSSQGPNENHWWGIHFDK